MDWTKIGVIVAILLAIAGGLASLITGLVKNYFTTLSARMDSYEKELRNHVKEETAYQSNVTALLTDMRSSLTKLETGAALYVKTPELRDIDKAITDSRHTIRNELHAALCEATAELNGDIYKLEQRVARIEDKL